jgi:hypothetical protein
MAAGLVAAGRLPLLGAEPGNGSNIDAATGPGAVKPIRRHLAGFEPVSDGPARRDSYTLTYDIVHWQDGLRQGTQRGSAVVGSLTVARRGGNGRVQYEVKQRTRFGGLDNFIEAEIVCATDELNTLRSWKIRSYAKPAAGGQAELLRIDETGENGAGRIQVEGGGSEYGFTATHPVVSQWTVPDYLLRYASPRTSVTFDLLQDLSLFKANQTLVFDGAVEVPVKDGRTVKLDTFAQTGEGVLPIHYLLDGQRRVQLVTQSIMSWALSDVA